jgi:hypothetical protein
MGNQDPASTFFEKIALFGRRSTFYSVFQNKTEFKVKILTNPEPYTGVEPETNQNNGPDNRSQKYWFKGRILDPNMAHEKFLPDPCDPSIASDSQASLALTSLHTTIYADEKPEGGVGSIITAFIQPGANNNKYDLQFMRYLRTDIAIESAVSLPEKCQLLADLDFSNADIESIASGISNRVASSGADFISYLRTNAFSDTSLFSDAFLAGMAGNAINESNFNAAANGDERNGPSSGTVPYRSIRVGDKYYCSFGFWQLNVCGKSFGGGQFIDYHGLQDKAQEEIYDFLINPDKQLEFVSSQMIKMFGPDGTIETNLTLTDDPQKAAEYFAVYFENCAECGSVEYTNNDAGNDSQTRGRMSNAIRFLEEYQNLQEEYQEAVATGEAPILPTE